AAGEREVCRVGDVAARVDQRAVQIEHNQTIHLSEYSAKDVGRRRHAGRLECSSHQYGGTVADHSTNLLFRQRLRAAAGEREVCRVGDVAARVAHRAVQIEHNQTIHLSEYSAKDVGVSQTFTRT